MIGCFALLGAFGHRLVSLFQMAAEALGVEEWGDVALFGKMRLVTGDLFRLRRQFDCEIFVALQVRTDEFRQSDGIQQALADA